MSSLKGMMTEGPIAQIFLYSLALRRQTDWHGIDFNIDIPNRAPCSICLIFRLNYQFQPLFLLFFIYLNEIKTIDRITFWISDLFISRYTDKKSTIEWNSNFSWFLIQKRYNFLCCFGFSFKFWTRIFFLKYNLKEGVESGWCDVTFISCNTIAFFHTTTN